MAGDCHGSDLEITACLDANDYDRRLFQRRMIIIVVNDDDDAMRDDDDEAAAVTAAWTIDERRENRSRSAHKEGLACCKELTRE